MLHLQNKSDTSKKLIKHTKEAFFNYVLPKIKAKYPKSARKFFVILTSSVAYGLADKYSDLDIFIIFPQHKDYLKYHKQLQKLVDSIAYPKDYYTICDKGIRFEFESFLKSDLAEIIKSKSKINWLKQTEWLLCWFVNSIVIYDPNKIAQKSKRGLDFFPDDILYTKVNNSFVLLLKYEKIMFLTKDTYVFDVYFFKLLKKIIDLLYWKEKRYVPHPKWSFFMLKYLNGAGKQFYREASLILSANKRQKIELINKWKILLTKKYDNRYLNKELAKHIIEDNCSGKMLPTKGNFYFKSFFEPVKKLNLVISYLNEKKLGREYYLVEETGLIYGRKLNYDNFLRIQDKYLPTDNNIYSLISDDTYRKIILYLVFIIWRKIRVAVKAPLRKNFFNQYWYNLQVFEHIIELSLRLKKERLVHERKQMSCLRSEKIFKKVADLLLESSKSTQDKKIIIYWECYDFLTRYILKNNILTEYQVRNPLIIQFDIEYWKYENMRL